VQCRAIWPFVGYNDIEFAAAAAVAR